MMKKINFEKIANFLYLFQIISLFLFIFLLFININSALNLWFLFIISIPINIIMSIIHLTRNSKKGIPISILVFNILFIFLIIISFSFNESIENKTNNARDFTEAGRICSSYCHKKTEDNFSYYQYNPSTYKCKCLNENNKTIVSNYLYK